MYNYCVMKCEENVTTVILIDHSFICRSGLFATNSDLILVSVCQLVLKRRHHMMMLWVHCHSCLAAVVIIQS